MKSATRTIIPLKAFFCTAALLAGCTSQTTSQQTTRDSSVIATTSRAGSASLVLKGGLIHTGTNGDSDGDGPSTATAIAVQGDTILAVGTDAEVQAFVGPDTRVVDLNGRLVIPGLIDSHIHAVAGAGDADACSLDDAELTIEQMKPIVAKCLADSPASPTTWLTVVKVNPAALSATAKDIDTLVSDRPAFFGGSDGHTAWVNSAGLKAIKLTRDTKDPEGGKIERDANGEPTGKLIDAATGLAAVLIPRLTTAENVEALKVAVKQFSAVGITSIRDPAVNEDISIVYETLLKANALPVRVAQSYVLQDMTKPADKLTAEATAFAAKHPAVTGLLQVDQVKVFADGVIEAPTWTAAMIEPYLDKDGTPTKNLGELYYEPELFKQQVTALHAAGLSVHVHAIGDRATRTALNAFEFAQPKGTPDMSSPDQIVHLQLVDPADYPRFAKNKVVADVQAEWAIREVYTVEALEPFLGKDRYSRVYPIKSLLQAGATMAGGSDWPVTGFSPFVGMQRAVTRRDNKASQPLVGDQAITIQQALAMYTTGSAATLPFRDLGVLAVGAKADIAVLNQNILTVDPYEIGNTVSELTVMNGVVVHEK